jgi:Fur family peroxide stress response transcriptional regulator
LICTECGEIRDLEVPGLDEILQQVSQDVGYKIIDYRLDLYGICSGCRDGD